MKRIKAGTWVLIVLLLAGIVGVILQLPAMQEAKKVYERELQATPTPTAEIQSVMLITYDPSCTPTPTPKSLQIGSKGDSVTALQTRLKSLGYYSGEVDGAYGSGTAEAVRLFQAQAGLTADGIAGQTTLAYLNASSAQTYKPTASPVPTPSVSPTPATQSMLKNGSSGDEVKQLQERLKTLGYYTGTVDGSFGKTTEEAVCLFQSQNSLTADGIAGKETLALLYSSGAKQVTVTPVPDMSMLDASGETPLLVNRTHPVGEDYVPENLVNLKASLPSSLVTVKGNDIQGNSTAVAALQLLFEAAKADGITGWQVSSGYRSYSYQQKLFNNKVAEYKEKGFSQKNAVSATKQEVADPGTSEHQTGLAFDITVSGTSFIGTKQQKWLAKNCWDYGFIIRYQEDKEKITGFIAECWHIRYVGLPHSTTMRDQNQCLEEYLGILD